MKTNNRVRRLLPLFAFALILLPFVDAYGCRCRERQPVCAEYASADAVFSGLVTQIVDSNYGPTRTVRFNVERAFRGVSGSVVELANGTSSCEAEFKEGEKYLVYAYRNAERNTLYSHYCTRTRKLADAANDLAYLNTLSQTTQSAEIVGVLSDYGTVLRGMNVVVKGGGKTYRTTSDETGWFRLVLPKPGNYTVRLLLPLYASVAGSKEELDAISNHAYTKTRLLLEYEVVVEPGKCTFVNPPLDIEFLEYEKHRGSYPRKRR